MRWMLTLAVTAALVGLAPLALAKGSKDRDERNGRHGQRDDGYRDSHDRYDDSRFEDDADLWEGQDEVRDDRRDYRNLARLVERWEDAVRDGDRRSEQAADDRLIRWIDQQLDEARDDVRAAKRESRNARYETYSDSHYHGSGHSPGCSHCSQGMGGSEYRDDRRDERDDRRDLRAAKSRYRSLRSIAGDLESLQWRFDRRVASRNDYRSKSRLLDDLLDLAASEIEGDRREVREDVVELIEDSTCSHSRRRR